MRIDLWVYQDEVHTRVTLPNRVNEAIGIMLPGIDGSNDH